MLPRLEAKRYIVPLPEGGSLPAVIDTDPPGRYVVKFQGAGQGAKALIAELIAAGLARELGLPIPDAAIIALADGFGRAEPNPEIQDLLRSSVGDNFGLVFLPGALGFDAATDLPSIDPDLAADIVWFDAYLANPDRTARNPNLLRWRGQIWLIDHGAALYFHHRWEIWADQIQSRFPRIKDHVLRSRSGDLRAADARLRPRLTSAAIQRIVAAIPDEWLAIEPTFSNVATHREAYVRYLAERLEGSRDWLEEAMRVTRQL